MKEKEIGYVYILTNPSFREDWVKIGKSSRPVDIRSKELDNTAVPLPFEIYATMKTSKFNEVEKLVHKSIDKFTDFRIRQNREFFNVPPQTALEIFKDIASTIDDAEITVSGNTEPSAEHTLNSTSPIQEANRHSVHQGTRDWFSINGHGRFPKNGCMLEVIKQHIEKYNLTYKRIESIFGDKIPHLIMPAEEVKRKQQASFDKAKRSRWHFKSPLKSSDGIEFLVSTQVGDNCPIDFKDIVSLSAQLGYKIEKI